jgi:hypothetical protein
MCAGPFTAVSITMSSWRGQPVELQANVFEQLATARPCEIPKANLHADEGRGR